jgi:hypothetical protein
MKRSYTGMSWIIVLVFSLILADVAAAQQTDRLSISGQIRQRSEYSAKDFDADLDNPFFSLLRTRINVGVKATDDVQAFVQFQDSRTWGGGSPASARGTMDGSAPLFDVHQAYFSVSNLFDTDFSAKVGRQEINVGNQRLVGAVGWHNVGRTFDAARFGYALENGALDFFAARLIGATGTPEGDNLFGAVGSFTMAKNNKIETLVLMDNSTTAITGGEDDGENRLQRYTAGAALNGAASGLEYELEGYYQMGDQYEAATGKLGSIGAYLTSARLSFVVKEDTGFKLGALFTLVSGDDDPTDGDVKNFDTLFATNHKFYGFMDYFIGAGSFAKGLQDMGVSIGMKANDKTSLALDLHNFTAPQSAAGLDTSLGQEIDFTLNYKYNAAFSLVGGVSAFMPGDDFGGEDTAFWGYLSSVVTF